MDEYFCPKCGATLDDQSGFDPSCGTWTCTECGQFLMDDDIADGDSYDGVAWFCDRCDSLLNRQRGFSDLYSSWTCTECGHRNSIDEDEIDDDSKNLSCPNCGDSLESQWLFSKYSDDWTCRNCGTQLHRDYSSDPFEIVNEDESDDVLECPVCGDVLEDQLSYNDNNNWTCICCGAKLHRDYYSAPYRVVYDFDKNKANASSTYKKQPPTEAHKSQNATHKQTSFFDSLVSTSIFSSQSKKTAKKRLTWRKVKKLIKKIAISILVIFLLCYFGFFVLQAFKQVEVGIDYEDTVGQDYKIMLTHFTNAGFENITTIPLYDLAIDEEHLADTVDSVSINGDCDFSDKSKYQNDTEIIIYYHSVKLISPPIPSQEATGKDYNDVQQQFIDAGFINIKTEVIYDLILGWFTKDGEVESITINGEASFDTNIKYRPDDEVVITYHTFRKNKDN